MPGFGFPCGHTLAIQSKHNYGQLAQLVEQRIENPRVLGSIPRLATKIQRPTPLGWASPFLLPANYAGFAPILRVPGLCTVWATGWPVRLSFAF